MSLRLRMQQAASRARSLLPDPGKAASFVLDQRTEDGGFADRAGKSDLYYTVFGLECSVALGVSSPTAPSPESYLRSFDKQVGSLDFVHLNCLARCWSAIGTAGAARRSEWLTRLESFRSADGGYALSPGQALGSAYGCILGLGTYQDLGAPLPDPGGLIRCLARLRAEDGGYANEAGLPIALTPATAAAVTVLAELNQPVDRAATDWLLARRDANGGFLAMPFAPAPDLLSTATALHALACCGVQFDAIRPRCLSFVRSLRAESGGFVGHPGDCKADCEYTFYGLLALGALAT